MYLAPAIALNFMFYVLQVFLFFRFEQGSVPPNPPLPPSGFATGVIFYSHR